MARRLSYTTTADRFHNLTPLIPEIVTSGTLVLWLVADFEALPYQVKPNFNKSENLETGTTRAINYSGFYAQ